MKEGNCFRGCGGWTGPGGYHKCIPSFSCVIIMRNEAKTLPRLGASLREFLERGGEWLCLDTGSTDDTVAVARALGAVVHEAGDRFRRVIGRGEADCINSQFVVDGEEPVIREGDALFDFSSARNHAASLARRDFVAMPDADEQWDRLDISALDAGIAEGMARAEYEFIFSRDRFGNPAVRFRHSKCYDRRAYRWAGIVHEVLVGDGKTVYFPEDAMLLSHYQNEKTDRSGYLKGLALDCFENPQSDRNSHYFAREMLGTGRPKSAIREFERHMRMEKWPTEAAQSMTYVGDAYKRLGNPDKAVECWQKSYSMESARREPLIRLAEHYSSRHDHQRAAAYSMAALSIPQGNFYMNDSSHYREVPHHILSAALWWLGRREEAREHYLKALEYAPEHPVLLNDRQFYFPEDARQKG